MFFLTLCLLFINYFCAISLVLLIGSEIFLDFDVLKFVDPKCKVIRLLFNVTSCCVAVFLKRPKKPNVFF